MDIAREREVARRLGSALARRREQAGLTQDQVSEKLGIGNQAISRIERGAVMPTLPRLFEFASVFGCRIDELVLAASDRESDQAAHVAIQIGRLDPDDRDIVTSVLNHLVDKLGQKRGKHQAVP